MPVGLVRKWTVVAIIAGVLGVIACKDGDEDPILPAFDAGNPGGTTGGGTMDAGADGGTGGTGGTGGGGDTGTPAPVYEAGAPCDGWDGGPIMCGSSTCFWHRTTLTCSNPGCFPVGDASVCAIDTSTLGGVDAGLPAFLPYNAPGVDSPACGVVGDSFEPIPDGGIVDGGTKGNGFIDTNRTVMSIPIALRYPGCCTTAGWCSGNTSTGMASAAGTPYAPANAGYGCLTHTVFYGANPNAVPTRCDTTTGELVDGGGGNGDGGGSDAGTDAGTDGGDDDAGNG